MSLSESRPQLPNNMYKSGRGGAGNFHHLPPASTTNSSSLATHPAIAPKPHAFFSGRGGAANHHPASERAMFSFDEEIERERLIHAHHVAPVYSVGRGGAGNMVPATASPVAHRRGSSSSVEEEDAARRVSFTASERSRSSAISAADRLGNKIRTSFSSKR